MAIHLLTSQLLRLPPLPRRVLMIGADALLIPLAVWLSFWLRFAHPLHPQLLANFWVVPSAWLVALPVYACSGQYKGLTRYVGSRALYRLAARNGLVVLLLAGVGALLQLPQPPRSSWVLLWLLLTGFTGAVRFGLRDLLLQVQHPRARTLPRVAIYGAGAAGAQLAAALRISCSHRVVLFVDDNPQLWRRDINGVPVTAPSQLEHRAPELDQVLLAIPSLSRSRRRQIVSHLQRLGLALLQVPSVEDITSGRTRIEALREVAIEDLLGRDPVPPDRRLLGPGIAGASICVTGAGGSIGSELCRQILKLRPRRLVLLERSEPSLYAIHQELLALLPEDVRLEPVLGSATDPVLMRRVFHSHAVNVVFHAAAYKHVPLVELNPLAGLANNVFSTRVVCTAARCCGVAQVVLISTDKAVRPTNVMGASKRLAELVVQANAEEEQQRQQEPLASSTRFSMVRFGNVLGSSGSVVPLFRRQIAEGGPITLTHPDIIRYFMTIPEAAQLVLQSTALAEGGDVFLLDMGDPVRIKDLAEQMVRLSGLSVRDRSNPHGDIDIQCTGLRPGEKLYEELLIEADSQPTIHPLIFRAHERFLPPQELWPQLDMLEGAIHDQDLEAALKLVARLVPEWQHKPTTKMAIAK